MYATVVFFPVFGGFLLPLLSLYGFANKYSETEDSYLLSNVLSERVSVLTMADMVLEWLASALRL